MHERVDAGVTAAEDLRREQAWRSDASAGQKLLKCLESGRIGDEFRVRIVNGAVGPPPMIPNKQFGAAHNFSRWF
jgi:hypothetical protein